MIATWMLYCIAVSALVGAGALALERALRALGRPARWAWAGAILLSAALPLAYARVEELRWALLGPYSPPAPALPPEVGPLLAIEPPLGEPTALQWADLSLLPAWFLAGLALFVGAAGLVAALRFRRRRWRPDTVAGVPVLVSPGVGPAVVGFLRGRIVLPEWALGWDEGRRRMMVEHEREHLRARDPLLFLGGIAAVVLVPWNAALWWQLRRLRLAMEMDCDARVLRRGADAREYGELLLEVGRRASSGLVPVAALSEPRSFLERRLRLLVAPRPGPRPRAAVLAAGACLAALAGAAAVPPPPGSFGAGEIGVAPAGPPPRRPVLELADVTRGPRLENGREVERLAREKYPPRLLRAGTGGSALVSLVVDERGAAVEPRVVRVSHPAFGPPALEVLRGAVFAPARRGDSIVAVRMRLPVVFRPRGPAGIVDPAVRVLVGYGAAELHEVDVRPELRNAAELARAVRAGHPPRLRAAGIGGSATVALVVTPAGTVGELQVVRASRPEFGAAAAAAARRARFTPGERAGRRVPVRVSLPLYFPGRVPPPVY